jgi:hypothetical protein
VNDDHPLTDADCSVCINILTERAKRWQHNLERMARAGFELPQLVTDNEANKTFATGVVREYFPGRMPALDTTSP